MSIPVQEGNILVGAGSLFRCFEGEISSITLPSTFVFSATPAPAGGFVAGTLGVGDLIRVFGTAKPANGGVFTVASWDHTTRTVTIDEEFDTAQAGAGGYAVILTKGGTSLGGTEDGTELSFPKEFHDVEAAEANVVLRKESTKMSGMASVNLLESTLNNLLLSIASGGVSGGTLTLATDGTVPEVSLRLETKAPVGKTTRKYVLYRAVATGPATHRRTKGANASIVTEFELLAVWDDRLVGAGGQRWQFAKVIDV